MRLPRFLPGNDKKGVAGNDSLCHYAQLAVCYAVRSKEQSDEVISYICLFIFILF